MFRYICITREQQKKCNNIETAQLVSDAATVGTFHKSRIIELRLVPAIYPKFSSRQSLGSAEIAYLRSLQISYLVDSGASAGGERPHKIPSPEGGGDDGQHATLSGR